MANRIKLWKVLPSQPGVRFVVGDTFAGLPTPPDEGVFAYASDVGNLCFFDGAVWVETGTGAGGPGGTTNNYFPAGWS